MAMLFPQGLRETVVCIRLMAMQFPRGPQPLRLDSRVGSSHSGREEPSRERTEEA